MQYPNQSAVDLLNQLILFEEYVLEKDFVAMFGRREGARLWRVFTGRFDYNIVKLARTLDKRKRRTLANYIAQFSTSD